MSNSATTIFNAVDLFSGGGGLTVGLKEAGFKVMAAVEIEKNAAATYKANHPEVTILEKDIRQISGKEILEMSPNGKIDLLAGCPPCQGFSSLTSKYKRIDPRNELVLEMARLVEEIQPRAVMMENVPGLADRGVELIEMFLNVLYAYGYKPEYDILQVADFGVPQLRRRFVLVAGKGFSIELPKPTHSKSGAGNLKSYKTVQETIKGLSKPVTMSQAQKNGGPRVYNWHVIRDMTKQNIIRLRHAKAGQSWREIPKEFRPDCHKSTNAGFPNVYGRMSWADQSPTITGGCTTLSKGRFGHPSQLRTISVREAALLQTFPNDYIFETDHMEHVCNIIGNALPCDFAYAISSKCIDALKEIS